MDKANEMVEQATEQIVKQKQKRPKKSEQMSVHTEPGDNTKYLTVSLELAKLPKVDFTKPEQVEERLLQFFELHAQNDMKPTVMGMGLALGVDRRRLWEMKSGVAKGGTTSYDLPTETLDLLKRAYDILENLMENYTQNGKINPVSAIFLMKNNFGYQDKTEYVVTPNMQTDSDYNAEDIKKRYLTDGTTLDSDNDSET